MIQITEKQLMSIVDTAVVQSMSVARHDMAGVVAEVVRNELPLVVKPFLEKDEVHARRHAVYTQPPSGPVSNYGEVLMAAGAWKLGKGECLASIKMAKSDNPKQFLFIEQYEQECGILRMDKGQPKADLDANQYHKIIKPGKSIWINFVHVKCLIDEVIATQKAKGWVIYEPMPTRQLELVEAV